MESTGRGRVTSIGDASCNGSQAARRFASILASAGKGIFFSSKAATKLVTRSHRIQVNWNEKLKDVFVSNRRFVKGTHVQIEVRRDSWARLGYGFQYINGQNVREGHFAGIFEQQASSIYRKAGIDGRHAFSAWFIEDYL